MKRLIALLLTLVLVQPAHAQNRHALVIGIDAYTHVEPLQKAVNDARAMAAALEQVGFSVDLQINSAETELLTAISDLASRAGRGDEVVVFFAGHGIEVDGQNYLLPADVPALAPGQELIMRRRSVPLSDITDALTAREVRVSLLILDACRNNPFPRQGTRSLGGSRGLARVAPPQGSYVIYSAAAGQEALDRLSNDDRNPNSVFTRALLPRITQPGLDLRQLVQEVRSEVHSVAMSVGHDQFPAFYDELNGVFFFKSDIPAQIELRKNYEALYARADPDAGAALWSSCRACHDISRGLNGVGPSLRGVVGRPMYAADGFVYSGDFSVLGNVWTIEALSVFLYRPREIPGTSMIFMGIRDLSDRLNLISYIERESN